MYQRPLTGWRKGLNDIVASFEYETVIKEKRVTGSLSELCDLAALNGFDLKTARQTRKGSPLKISHKRKADVLEIRRVK